MSDTEQVIVVAIIDAQTVVINRGTKHGGYSGEAVAIYNWGPEIFHPTTKRSLGRLEIMKGYGKLVHVQEQMATVAGERSYGQEAFVASDTGALYTNALASIASTQLLLASGRKVQVGDLVKLV